MKVGIDTFGCDHAKSGLGSYILNFISNLPENSDFSFELFGAEVDRYTYTTNNGLPYNSVNISSKLSAEIKWHKSKIKYFLKKNKYDFVIYPSCVNVIPVDFKTKGLVVVNGIISRQISGLSKRYIKQLKKGLSHCQIIVAASHFIKKDLISLGFDSGKITVVRNGIDHKLFFPALESDEEFVNINPFAIKKPYFVYATKLSGPEKKHEELIRAFEIFKKKTGLPHRLVLAGEGVEYGEKIHDMVFNCEYASDIFIVGYFPHDSLPKLYGAAEACIFPSVSEGVGLPILEAMACGLPVLCSREGALPEIGGDAALYFDSDNISEISELMEKVVSNSELKNDMIKKGLDWSSKFSWEDTVKNTLELLK